MGFNPAFEELMMYKAKVSRKQEERKTEKQLEKIGNQGSG